MGSTTVPVPGTASAPTTGDHANAHWWLVAALAAIIAGFWGSFFAPMRGPSLAHTVHGITATLWVVALITQACLISRRMRVWHRRVAYVALGVLAVMTASGLQMIAVMLTAGQLPIELARLLSFLDFVTIGFLLTLVTLAWRARRTPAAHRRYMAATVLLAFPPALTRLFAFGTPWPLEFLPALHLSMLVVDAILVVLIVRDARVGRRERAYPMSLAFFVASHVLMFTASGSGWYAGFSGWYGRVLTG